ncbi:hypothetical protein [Bacillus sp. 1P02SD]|uniref:hypothetical protein n=1 Tax=Bacillus sp. 1P02SD TaxID=3132264 RepID=UPI0039A1FB6E
MGSGCVRVFISLMKDFPRGHWLRSGLHKLDEDLFGDVIGAFGSSLAHEDLFGVGLNASFPLHKLDEEVLSRIHRFFSPA